jgi:Putative bacterial sensory transduction regulator
MTFDEVRACLEAGGWPVDVVSEATMRSRFRSGDRIFPVFVHLEPEYATFALIPFARLPTDESGDLLADRLLVLNREMNLAKFSVDEDGDVILSVEYPLPDLDPSEVRDAVDVLSFYAEKYRAEVEAAVSSASVEGG